MAITENDKRLKDDALVFARVLMDEANIREAAAALCDGRMSHARDLKAVAGRYHRSAAFLSLLAVDHYFADDGRGTCFTCGGGVEAHTI